MQQSRSLTYVDVEPLDWFQFRALLQDALGAFNETRDNRWQRIASLVNGKCPHSSPHAPEVYEGVFDKLASVVPELRNLSAHAGLSHRVWNEILYTNAQAIFNAPAFMNLGYADLDPRARQIHLKERDEPYRLFIQLYECVLGGVDLRGLEVLEVGCGAGGGASYIKRYHHPASVTGVDVVAANIENAARLHPEPGLNFVVGDAEALEFPDASFDAVVNIESSHHYSSVVRFFDKASRVLRPGGYFLFADLRTVAPEWGSDRTAEVLHGQLARAGLRVVRAENITRNVIRSMDLLDEAKRMMLAASNAIGGDLTHFNEILLCKGSHNYRKMISGELEYHVFVCRK